MTYRPVGVADLTDLETWQLYKAFGQRDPNDCADGISSDDISGLWKLYQQFRWGWFESV